jgi:CheY-like chemotaxis protein
MTIVIDREATVYHCNGKGDRNRTAIGNKTSPGNIAVERIKERDLSVKRILVVDDEPDLTLTFKAGLEQCHCDGKKKFEVYTYNNPLQALSEFKPHCYDLMLVDVYMPDMSGFELCEKVLELDPNLRVCFISAAEINIQALREVYPKLGFGCFIKKPVEMEYLVERLCVELD